MLIISDDHYYILGLRHLMPKFISHDNGYVLFDAGGGVVYVMGTAFINEIKYLDTLSAFLANRCVCLNKNAPISDYIVAFSHACRPFNRITSPEKLTPRETLTLRRLASKYLALPVVDMPEIKAKGRSYHKRNGLRKLGLKNDMVFCSVVASWHARYSQLTVQSIHSGSGVMATGMVN